MIKGTLQIAFCVCFLLSYTKASAQQVADVSQNSISNAGFEGVDPSGNAYSMDIGGTFVTTASSSSFIVTQGFEQPNSTISDIIIFNPPNAFSPDGDGVNDQFILPLPEVMMNNSTVVIVNRWGDEISRIENYNNLDNVWDGSYQQSGELVTNGTYFYVVESTEAVRKFSGWVQVVR